MVLLYCFTLVFSHRNIICGIVFMDSVGVFFFYFFFFNLSHYPSTGLDCNGCFNESTPNQVDQNTDFSMVDKFLFVCFSTKSPNSSTRAWSPFSGDSFMGGEFDAPVVWNPTHLGLVPQDGI